MQHGRLQLEVRERGLLVVEDNHDDYELLERVLANEGFVNPLYRVVVGSDALDYLLRRHAHQGHEGEALPALTLLDLKLPGLGGLDVLRQVRGQPELRAMPVVVTSTSRNPQEVRACYEAGANAFLFKSVQFEEYARDLAETIHYWLRVAELPA